MQDSAFCNVGGCEGHPGDQGVFIFTPKGGGKFLISPKRWPNWYVYMQNNFGGNVRGLNKDPGPQGHWYVTIKDIRVRTFLLSTTKWPKWYMYMKNNFIGDIRGCRGDPGPQGHFKLLSSVDYYVD